MGNGLPRSSLPTNVAMARHIPHAVALLLSACALAGAADPDPAAAAEKKAREQAEKYIRAVQAEDETARKLAERATKPGDTEREKWYKRLDEVFTKKVPEDATGWFDLITVGQGEWKRDGSKYFAEFHERVVLRLDLGKDAVITRGQFADYAARFLGPDSPPWRIIDYDGEARGLFKPFDANKDGSLTKEECSPDLQERFADADADHDGKISPAEYREYLRGKVGYVLRNGPPPSTVPPPPPGGEAKPVPPPEPDEPKPKVLTDLSQLPKGVPGWFRELDKDKDLQVGLYEWVAAGRPPAEFVAMDLNRDGLLEVAEYLRWAKMQAEEKPPELKAAAVEKEKKK